MIVGTHDTSDAHAIHGIIVHLNIKQIIVFVCASCINNLFTVKVTNLSILSTTSICTE